MCISDSKNFRDALMTKQERISSFALRMDEAPAIIPRAFMGSILGDLGEPLRVEDADDEPHVNEMLVVINLLI